MYYPPAPTGYPPAAPMRRSPGRLAGAVGGLRHQLVMLMAITVAALLLGLLRTPRGWWIVAAAWLVVALVAARRDAAVGPLDGRLARWRAALRPLGEYALVFVLAWMLATAPTAPPGERPKPRRRPPAAEASQPDPLAAARTWLAKRCKEVDACQRLTTAASEAGQPPPTTRRHR